MLLSIAPKTWKLDLTFQFELRLIQQAATQMVYADM